MPTYYSVIQYVPDALADERMNIGVIVCNEDSAEAQFLHDWRRIRCFNGGGEITFLREFAQRVAHQVEPVPLALNGAMGRTWDVSYLRELSRDWSDSIQFTPPRASLESPGALIDTLASWFLKESLETKTKARDKRAAVKIATDALTQDVAQRIGKVPSGVLRPSFPIKGKLETQVIDLVAATRKTLFGVQALSFEMRDLRDLRADLGAAKWAISDIRQGSPDLPLAVVHLPPTRFNAERAKSQEEMYRSAQETMAKLNVDFVAEKDIAPWAHRVVGQTLYEWQEWAATSRQVAY